MDINVVCRGPKFQIESDEAFLVLGHSERKRVGEFWASSLYKRGIFADIEVVTLNKAAAMIGRSALEKEMKKRTVFSHSAGITRIKAARQIIAINPPEPVSVFQLLKRANDIMSDPLQKEEGSHPTDTKDLIGAGFELLRSPASTVATIMKISRGYSTTAELTQRSKDFPAGRAIVHSELDGFGFSDLADMEYAADRGVTVVTLPEHYHNEVLFAPNRTLDMMTPSILPYRA